MKVSRSKTTYLWMNKKEDEFKVILQDLDLTKITKFKYLGSIVQSNRKCGCKVKSIC